MFPRAPESTPDEATAPASSLEPALPDPRQVVASEFRLIERIVRTIARKHGLMGDDADDFTSYAEAKLVFDDYAVLRRFRNGSTLSTFLHTVIANLFRDFANERWGKWRPSAAALRTGSWGVRLETLVVRDGWSWQEAITFVRSSVPDAPREREMFAFLAALPGRMNHRKTASLDMETAACDGAADDGVERAEAEAVRVRVLAALESCFSTLPAEDRLILRMKFWDECRVSEISRTLSIDQKLLYRRIPAVLKQLETQLRAAGVEEAVVRALIEDELPWDPPARGSASVPRGSTEGRAV